VKQGTSDSETKSSSPSGQEALANRYYMLWWKASALTAIVFWTATTFAQQPIAGGANLFAPSLQVGKEIDAERALLVTPFYRAPTSKTAAKPGALVRAEPATDFALPPGVTATRILYHTRTANNADTLASGVVLIPYGRPPTDGWPVLAWSHGTSGVARNCAPSLMRSLFYNWEGLYEYVMLGYAVVATDYAGLGTDGRHAYLDMSSNATDVVNSIPAAHAAVPDLAKRWLVIGHSQGGLSSLGVAELEGEIKDPNFIGTVALAGASDLQDGIDNITKARIPALNGLLAFWVYGVKTLYPELDLKDILTNKALSIYDRYVEDGCSAASGAFAALATDEMLQPGWNKNQYVKQFLARNRPGTQSAYGPLLLVSGGDDFLFTESAGRIILQRFCVAGAQIQRKVYPGLGHDPVVYGSWRDQMDWIAARFAGRPAPNDCSAQSEAGRDTSADNTSKSSRNTLSGPGLVLPGGTLANSAGNR
jgi:pimeloyl-ACP methyl ester carboxylesterase